MAKKGNDKSRNGEPPTIKMPPSLSEAERLQAKLVAAGLSADHFKILSVRKGEGGKGLEVEWSVSLPEDMAEQFTKDLTIRPFDPDSKMRSKVLSVELEEVRKPEPPVKLWTGTERSKRSKPKSDVPEVT